MEVALHLYEATEEVDLWELGFVIEDTYEGKTLEEINVLHKKLLKAGESVNKLKLIIIAEKGNMYDCLLYTSPSPRDRQKSRMPSSA